MPHLYIRDGLVVPPFVLGLPNLNQGAKLVYAALCHIAKLAGQDHCAPGQKILSAMLGQSVRSIQNHLIELVRNGFIIISTGYPGNFAIYQLVVRPVVPAHQQQKCRPAAPQAAGMIALFVRPPKKIGLIQELLSLEQQGETVPHGAVGRAWCPGPDEPAARSILSTGDAVGVNQ